jgi:hypothetical protein
MTWVLISLWTSAICSKAAPGNRHRVVNAFDKHFESAALCLRYDDIFTSIRQLWRAHYNQLNENWTKLDYSVAQWPHIIPLSPEIPHFKFSSAPIFILYYVIPYTNLHTKFQKNSSMFPACRPNTNLLRFHASKYMKISLCFAKFQLKI